MGRAPLDEDAIRELEERHPDIQFDWPRILKGEPDPAPDRPREAAGQQASLPKPLPGPDPVSPAHAQLGSEGLARLRARYAEVLAAIGRRVPDPGRQGELKTLAERLNPDTWVTADEVRTGLAQYEEVLESLRNAVGRRRRRRPRPEGRPGIASEGGADTGTDQAGGPGEAESEDG